MGAMIGGGLLGYGYYKVDQVGPSHYCFALSPLGLFYYFIIIIII